MHLSAVAVDGGGSCAQASKLYSRTTAPHSRTAQPHRTCSRHPKKRLRAGVSSHQLMRSRYCWSEMKVIQVLSWSPMSTLYLPAGGAGAARAQV